ncbi:heme exporter protein CcmB [Amycolatopsis sp. WGS_07]|uniref:heme exporter protein CcmB n=1 Tax=Amycolatopsis sp. WGS_07 TaxID=3076764 RepID=UPI0038736C6D
MGAPSAVAVIAAKDLRVELRARHATVLVGPFVATLVVSFGLSLGPGGAAVERLAPGLLWLAALFGAVLLCRRAYEAEFDDDAILGLLLSPRPNSVLYLGKAIAIAIQLAVLESGVFGLVAVLYGLPAASSPGGLAAALLLGALGMGGLGALLGAVSGAARTRESVLPLLVFPLSVPMLIAGAKATALALYGPTGELGRWLGLLFVVALVFWAAGTLLFDYMVED